MRVGVCQLVPRSGGRGKGVRTAACAREMAAPARYECHTAGTRSCGRAVRGSLQRAAAECSELALPFGTQYRRANLNQPGWLGWLRRQQRPPRGRVPSRRSWHIVSARVCGHERSRAWVPCQRTQAQGQRTRPRGGGVREQARLYWHALSRVRLTFCAATALTRRGRAPFPRALRAAARAAGQRACILAEEDFGRGRGQSTHAPVCVCVWYAHTRAQREPQAAGRPTPARASHGVLPVQVAHGH